jgi:predicted DNA-binding ribbon-helix-helix protein
VAVVGSIQKRSVIIASHRTSVSLEPEFWAALKEIAQRRDKSINELVTEIDGQRRGNLSSALRVYVLTFLQGQLASAAEPREQGTEPEPAPVPETQTSG